MSKLLRSKQIPYNKITFPHTYEQLRRDGMPSSAFHADMFVPDDFKDFAGIPEFGEGQVDFTKSDAPAMRLQACFIPGGLVLSMYIHHSILDCSGVTTFWSAFAANVSRASGTRGLDKDEEYRMVDIYLLHKPATNITSCRERRITSITVERATRSTHTRSIKIHRQPRRRLLLRRHLPI
jgi:hypothetical protein